MATTCTKYLLLMICMAVFCTMPAQLTATDTSARSVRHYRGIIQHNRQLVNFIEYTFTQRGVPKHMRNLAIIESGLDHNVVSHAGAKGVWQFMAEHANAYGLSEQDRSDMYKSTKTAVNSLINLYNKYGNWVTVVAAYNCGEGNIRKAMDKAGSDRYTAFSAFLPSETQNHVLKFLNACYATGELQQVLTDYYKTSGAHTAARPTKTITPSARHFKKNRSNLSETTLNSAYNIELIAQFLNTPVSKILSWNPQLEKNLSAHGESIFYLPRNLMLDFEINRNKILNASLKKQ